MKHRVARVIAMMLSFTGAAVLGVFYLYVTMAPKDFDQRTRHFAIAKIERRFDEKFAKIANSDTMDKVRKVAGRFSDKLKKRVADMRADLDAGIAEFIADILAAACKLDCERRDEAARAVRAFYESAIAHYGVAIERVKSFVEGQYDEIMAELRRDLRIFSGSSGLALFFAFLLTLFRGRAAAHLLPVSLALSVSTALAAVWYLLGQDWVMTVIFSNYWGWAYAVFLGFMSLLLADIAANRARLTSIVLNMVGHGFGVSFGFSPC